MSEPFVFDPRCDLCKVPFGAVVCGREVTIHCRPMTCEGFSNCSIVLHSEFAKVWKEYELSVTGAAGDRTSQTWSGTTSASGGVTAPAVIWTNPATAATGSSTPGR